MPAPSGLSLERARDELEWEYLRFQLRRRLQNAPPPTEPPAPTELHLELTHRCNLKCVMCEHWRLEHSDPRSVGREMSFEDIREAVEGSALLRGIGQIVVTGGEPWLRHDIVGILAFLGARFPEASIIVLTNFWNTGHLRLKLSELRGRGLKALRLGSSLDGIETTHDEVRGQRGAFAGLISTVKALRGEFPDIPFGFTFTITPRNAREVFRAYRFVEEELGCSLGAQWVIERDGAEPVRWDDGSRAAAMAGIAEVLRHLCRKHEALRRWRSPERERWGWLWSELLYWDYLSQYGAQPERFSFFRRCGAGRRHVMLDPEGELFFCPVNRDMSAGNVRNQPLDAVWSSDKARAVREFVDSGRCHCWLRCMATPVLDQLIA
ncbi:MAG: radical SAM protein [Elusimicrobia bacterium]|nr:radical SAM protein [Elusimicrobiota bacterium]